MKRILRVLTASFLGAVLVLVIAVPARADGPGQSWIYPVQCSRTNVPFGEPNSAGRQPRHTGVDFGCPMGTSVHAVADGEVVWARWWPEGSEPAGYGRTLWIYHGMGPDGRPVYSVYAHLSEIEVGEGDRVQQGQVVALTGDTGFGSGPHLHFAVGRKDPDEGGWEFGDWDDPNLYLGHSPQLEAAPLMTRRFLVAPPSTVQVPQDWRLFLKRAVPVLGGVLVFLLVLDYIRAKRRLRRLERVFELARPRPRRPTRRFKFLFFLAGVGGLAGWLADSVQYWPLAHVAATGFILWLTFVAEAWLDRFWRWFAGKSVRPVADKLVLFLALFFVGYLGTLIIFLQVSQIPPVTAFSPNSLYAGVYGHLGPGGWGTLSQATTAEEAVALTEDYASRVQGWTDRRVVPLANLVVRNEDDETIQGVIDLCTARGCIVMLDISPQEDVSAVIRRWAGTGSHVWFDLDVEHAGGPIDAAELNKYAAAYFEARRQASFAEPGVFAFYDFRSEPQVRGQIQWSSGGSVVPIFDGHCHGQPCKDEKWAQTQRFMSNYSGASAYGVMEFVSRWGCLSRYGDCGFTPEEYFRAFEAAPLFIYLAQ